MATGGASPIFIDANVLVHAAVRSSPLNVKARETLEQLERSGTELWISRQVMREYLAVLSRPQIGNKPIPKSLLIADVRNFETRYGVAEDGPDVTRLLLRLITSIRIGGKRIHDANIVATMLARGITSLLTENISDFGSFKQHITLIPL